MNQTRWICLLKCLCFGLVAGLPVAAPAEELIRRRGQYIHLTTDLVSAGEAETLVSSFDAAVPQWIEFWRLPPDSLTGWRVDACVIRDKTTFRRQGLIPPGVPDFPFGYALDNQVWVLAQESEYYTRHLLLHEGVHSLAFFHFGGAGPTWFREGTAELLSTHSGVGPDLTVNQVPGRREDVPYWGRFKLMKQLREDRTVPTLETVMRYQPDLRGDVRSYGWSWAAAMMLNAYPEYRDALLAAARRGRDDGPGFNRKLQARLQNRWPVVAARWRLMCHDLDYGFDWSRELVDLSVRDPKWDGQPIRLEVNPDQGWQSVGVRIPGRTKIRLSPSGEVTLASDPRPWTSRPPGITYQYRRGRPLGQLLVAVLPNAVDPDATFLQPLQVHAVKPEQTLEIPRFSWLLLRVNDHLADLGNNTGKYRVTVEVDQ